MEEGKEILAAYVHPDLLPRPIIFEVVSPADICEYISGPRSGIIRFNPNRDTATVVHEAVHGIEDTHPEILAACQAFLLKRAAGEAPVDLFTITGDPAHKGEWGYKDRWVQLGGTGYTGRIYSKGTEILTTGLTRLHKDPARFAREDPEFFSFVVKTLRKW